MRSFDAIDAELSALMGREATVTQAVSAAAQFRGLDLASVDAMLADLGVASSGASAPETVVPSAPTEPVPSSEPLDADSLFEDVGTGRQSMMAPLDADTAEAVVLAPDASFDASGDLAGLLEGSNSLMPPAPEGVEDIEALDELGSSVVALEADDDYEEMQAVTTSLDDDDDLHSTEIEIVED